MRTRTRVCLLALCAALLTGCGGRTAGAKAYDPAAAAQALLDAKVFDQELEVLDADLAGSYLGLSSEPEEAVVYTSLEGGYEELAVLRMADAEAPRPRWRPSRPMCPTGGRARPRPSTSRRTSPSWRRL